MVKTSSTPNGSKKCYTSNNMINQPSTCSRKQYAHNCFLATVHI